MNQDSPSALKPGAPTIAPPPPRQSGGTPRRSRGPRIWLVLIAVVLVAAYFLWPRKPAAQAPAGSATGGAPGARGRGAGAIPVVAVKVTQGNIPVYYTGLGGVTPIYTVAVKSRVDGQLMQVHYTEGELVKQGAPLLEIDPRPYQVQLDQAEGQLIKDQALLENARIDLTRYKTLLTQNAIPEQQVATQQYLVTQDEGTVKTDQASIDSAKLNLVYCHITSPITGRVGLRLVDPGNIVHASDANGLVVITQIEPITVIFTLPEDQLPIVLQKLHAGQHLAVDAFDRTSNVHLETGVLSTVDNQIDPTTGTLRLRATFDNKGGKLFANQFINVRLLVQMKTNVTLVPTATVQRNTTTTYVFLVKPDSSVTYRPITLGTTEGDNAEVTSGLQPGDVVVMTGVDKLQDGTKVVVHYPGETTGQSPDGGTGAPEAEKNSGQTKGGNPSSAAHKHKGK